MKSLTDEELNNLRDELLFQLFKDAEIPFDNNLTDEQKQNFLFALIVMRHAEKPDEKLLNLQNKYLSAINKRAQIDVQNAKFKNNFCITQENVLNFNADMLLIITDTLLEDANALMENKNSFDNELLFKAGIEFKHDLVNFANFNAYKADRPAPIILSGYNLPAKFIAKIIYNKNLIFDINNEKITKKLKNDADFIKFFNNLTANLNILFNFIKNNAINSLAIYIKNNNYKDEIINLIKNYNKKAKIKIIIN